MAFDSPLDLAQLAAALPVHGLGFPRRYEPRIPSTNSLAMELIAQGAASGTLILTDEQPAGRGRQGRAWVTLPNQQLLLSVILHPPFAPHWLVMAAAHAATEALIAADVPPERVGIKWPNDILVDGRKVAGILIETTTATPGRMAAVVGMGMNVNGSLAPWPELAERATTLRDALGHAFAREPLIIAFLRALGQWCAILATDPTATTDLRQQWRARLTTLGQPTTVHQGDHLIVGIAEDVAEDGTLMLRLPEGEQRLITWGDVL
jgi:BirA family biotin operon repressor/biotin-[acetyl-CoA-carboxylase] ligase